MAWGEPMGFARKIVMLPANEEGETAIKKPTPNQKKQPGEFSTKSPVNFHLTLYTQNSLRAFQHPYG